MLEFILETTQNKTALFLIQVICLTAGSVVGTLYLRKWFYILFKSTTHIAQIQGSEKSVELKGTIQCQIPLDFDDHKVVYYKKTDQEYRRSGKSRRWVNLNVDTGSTSFSLSDGSGRIGIEPEKASFEIDTHRTEKRSSTQRTLYQSLAVGEPAYVLGNVMELNGKLVIAKHANEPFIISDYPESKLLWKYGSIGWGTLMIGLLIAALMGAICYSEWSSPWEGAVKNKYTYKCGKKNHSTCYAVDVDGYGKKTIAYPQWNLIHVGDYLIKEEKDYIIRIQK